MFCFKCGKKLPARVVNCPDCDTPQKRRQRYRRRMILGLFIFLAGAIAGSVFDTIFFKGQAWNHSFLGYFAPEDSADKTASATVIFSHDDLNSVTTSEAGIASESATATSSEYLSWQTPSDIATSSETPPPPAVASGAPIASEPSPVMEVASAALPVDTTPVASAPLPAEFPTGRLVYSKVEALEKGAGSNYHGYMARNGSELIFSSNRVKIDGASVYQCFHKKPTADAKAERAFPWPGNVWTPETTPDSNMVVFSSDSSSPEHIFVFDRKSSNSMPLTTGTSKNMMPAISPDGRLVAFVSNRKGSNHIWLVGLDGSNLMQITTGNHEDREPRWAPDGQSLIFTRIFEPLKKSHIMRIQLEPLGEPQAIVATDHRNWLADLSPDGTMLAFTRSESSDGSRNVLVLLELENGHEQVIKPLGGAECFRPIWNQDCSGFVFHASNQQGRSLYQALFLRESN